MEKFLENWEGFLNELEAAPKKAVASLNKFRKDMLGGGGEPSEPFTKDGFPKDFNKPGEFSAPPMAEGEVEEDILFKPLSKSQKAHSSKLIRIKYKDKPLDKDGIIDPKVARDEKEENLYEKKDRCYNIAKRKYKAFPSAYASGAIVKCRKGKIWKKKK
jgi:hypothetical protein